MKENKELEKDDLYVDADMDVDCDIGQEITCYIETWFDVDKKFGIHISDEDGAWLNMYGKYNPFADTLRIECEISRDDGSEYFDYAPTAAESQLVKDMITEKIREVYGQTPQEFCEDAVFLDGEEVYVYQNTRNLSVRQLLEQDARIKAHLKTNDYEKGGSISIALPMSMAGEHYQNMIDYCRSRGISKIIVEDKRDIASDSKTLRRVLNDICGNGITVELAETGISYAPVDSVQEQQADELTMGGQS